MPTVGVDRDELLRRIDFEFGTDIEKFEDLLFEFGLEFDGEECDAESGNILYRIEVPANRCDLLSLEGISLALNTYLHQTEIPLVSLKPSKPNIQLFVKAATAKIRPYVTAAILRGVTFTPLVYRSLIDLQEKLTANLGRRRALVAIGTSDLSKLTPPFVYDAKRPEDIRFVPLGYSQSMSGLEMVSQLALSHVGAYVKLIQHSDVYPVLYDSVGQVLSVPPVINSNEPKITLETKDLFIDVTACDVTKANWILNTFVASMSEHCQDQFSVEPVEVIYEDDHPCPPHEDAFASEAVVKCQRRIPYPQLDLNKEFSVSLKYVRTICGIPELTREQIVGRLLPRMMLECRNDEHDEDRILVKAPIIRNDLLHPCDVVEDVGIAFGFNRIRKSTYQSTSEQPINTLSEQIRKLTSQCGYIECLNWGLCSIKDNFDNLRRPFDSLSELLKAPLLVTAPNYKPIEHPVVIHEPKTKEFEIPRTSLIPGILKTISSNQSSALPLKLFEIGDCCVRDLNEDVQAKNRRYLSVAYCDAAGSGLEFVHGVLDVIMTSLQIEPEYASLSGMDGCVNRRTIKKWMYRLIETTDFPVFMNSRSVAIEMFNFDDSTDRQIIGIMGVVHPDVVKNNKIPIPVSLFEISLEPFLSILNPTDLSDY